MTKFRFSMHFGSSSYFSGLFKQREKALHTGLADWASAAEVVLRWRVRELHMAAESALTGHGP